MSTTAHLARCRVQFIARPGFNVQMAFAALILLISSIVVCRLTSVHVPNAGSTLLSCALAFAGVLPLPLYLNVKGHLYLRDSVVTVLWSLLLYGLLHFPVVFAARVGMGIGLKDALLTHWDQSIGVRVPAIMTWASNHWLGLLANKSYALLIPLLPISLLLPIVAGKLKNAQQFVTGNLIAFALGLPLFALLPAIGPWFGYHFAAGAGQAECQATFLLMRSPGPYEYQSAGVVCFPSFHVIWAILLCAIFVEHTLVAHSGCGSHRIDHPFHGDYWLALFQ